VVILKRLMKINLKELCKQKLILKSITESEVETITKTDLNRLKRIAMLLDEVESDLEITGESKIELDKPRLDAIEERNKMLSFNRTSED
jgi:predicted DNA-binding antitoxin AbrB/MazE fold protein